MEGDHGLGSGIARRRRDGFVSDSAEGSVEGGQVFAREKRSLEVHLTQSPSIRKEPSQVTFPLGFEHSQIVVAREVSCEVALGEREV